MRRIHSWQESVNHLLDCRETTGQRIFKYSLPRQCGATTFLIDNANTLSYDHSVLFLVHSDWAVDDVKEKLNPRAPVTVKKYRPRNLVNNKSVPWDYILCDNITYNKPDVEEIYNCGKFIIWIDTV